MEKELPGNTSKEDVISSERPEESEGTNEPKDSVSQIQRFHRWVIPPSLCNLVQWLHLLENRSWWSHCTAPPIFNCSREEGNLIFNIFLYAEMLRQKEPLPNVQIAVETSFDNFFNQSSTNNVQSPPQSSEVKCHIDVSSQAKLDLKFLTQDIHLLAQEFSRSSLGRDLLKIAKKVKLESLNLDTFQELINGILENRKFNRHTIVAVFFFCSTLAVRALRKSLTLSNNITSWCFNHIHEESETIHFQGGWLGQISENPSFSSSWKLNESFRARLRNSKQREITLTILHQFLLQVFGPPLYSSVPKDFALFNSDARESPFQHELLWVPTSDQPVEKTQGHAQQLATSLASSKDVLLNQVNPPCLNDTVDLIDSSLEFLNTECKWHSRRETILESAEKHLRRIYNEVEKKSIGFSSNSMLKNDVEKYVSCRMITEFIEEDQKLSPGPECNLSEMFNPFPKNSTSTPCHILIRGESGFGKSFLCSKIAHDWANGRQTFSAFPNTKPLFLLLCRLIDVPEHSTVENYLIDYLANLCGVDTEEIENATSQSEKEIMVIFDGLNEAMPNHQRDVKCLLQGNPTGPQSVFRKAIFIITSCPDLDEDMYYLFDRHICLKGIPRENALQFIQSLNKEDLSESKNLEQVAKVISYLPLEIAPVILVILSVAMKHDLLENVSNSNQLWIKLLTAIFQQNNTENFDSEIMEQLFNTGRSLFQYLIQEKTCIAQADIPNEFLKYYEFLCQCGVMLRKIIQIKNQNDFEKTTLYKPIHTVFLEFLTMQYLNSEWNSLKYVDDRQNFLKKIGVSTSIPFLICLREQTNGNVEVSFKVATEDLKNSFHLSLQADRQSMDISVYKEKYSGSDNYSKINLYFEAHPESRNSAISNILEILHKLCPKADRTEYLKQFLQSLPQDLYVFQIESYPESNQKSCKAFPKADIPNDLSFFHQAFCQISEIIEFSQTEENRLNVVLTADVVQQCELNLLVEYFGYMITSVSENSDLKGCCLGLSLKSIKTSLNIDFSLDKNEITVVRSEDLSIVDIFTYDKNRTLKDCFANIHRLEDTFSFEISSSFYHTVMDYLAEGP